MLPGRFFQPKTNGGLANKYIDRSSFEKAKRFYYALVGWDAQGVPLPEKVEEALHRVRSKPPGSWR